MWRAFFLAIGIYLVVVGGECLVFERAAFHSQANASPPPYSQGIPYFQTQSLEPQGTEIKFPDWAPYMFLSVGAVVICYSFTIVKT